MSQGVILFYLLNFAAMYALPQVFFRKDGKFNLRWLLVGSPFGLSPLFLILAAGGWVKPLISAQSTAGHWLELASVPFSFASIGLIFSTMATHTVPLALWHQNNDAPKSIVTHGPYKRIRHPFYASFVLLLVGATLLSPNVGTIAALLIGVSLLTWTARGEEKRLLASEFGSEYAAYLKRTGRFMPRIVMQ